MSHYESEQQEAYMLELHRQEIERQEYEQAMYEAQMQEEMAKQQYLESLRDWECPHCCAEHTSYHDVDKMQCTYCDASWEWETLAIGQGGMMIVKLDSIKSKIDSTGRYTVESIEMSPAGIVLKVWDVDDRAVIKTLQGNFMEWLAQEGFHVHDFDFDTDYWRGKDYDYYVVVSHSDYPSNYELCLLTAGWIRS